MTRLLCLALVGGAGALATSLLTLDPPVDLQPASPGTPQIGNVNVTGKIVTGALVATSLSTSAQAVVGTATSISGSTYSGMFKNYSAAGTAVRGYANSSTGSALGGDFQTDSSGGTAVRGLATAATGTTNGGYFQTGSNAGYGLRAISTASTGSTIGGFFQTASSAGIAVLAKNTATSGVTYGGKFEITSPGGRAVEGKAILDTGVNYGGWFETASPSGTGVIGMAPALTGSAKGGSFTSRGTSGRGAQGYANATSGTNFGVHGSTLSFAAGYGVYSYGNFAASGVKSFRIDHPLDPENKYLLHYCAEGPEPLNHYRGTVVTDARGYATVLLPDYFEEINKNPTYQLTVVDGGDDFVQVKVTKPIRSNQFQIRTSKGGVEVCWRVEATRNDRYVRTYGAPTERDKAREERGKFQHPELYGLPAERGTEQQGK